jgi:putative ABC transport system permease protein
MKKINIFNLARQNIKRRLFRNLMIIVTVSLAIGTLFTASMLLRGVETGIREGVSTLGADLIVMPQSVEVNTKALITGEADSMLVGGPQTDEFVEVDLLSDVAKVIGVEQVTAQLYLSTWDEGGTCCRFNDVQIVGFDPKTDFVIQRLVENKYENKQPFAHNEIFLGYQMTPEMLDYEVLSAWKVYGYNFKVIGRLKKTGTALDFSMFVPFSGVYIMAKTAAENAGAEQGERLRKVKEGMVSSFLVKVDQLAVDPKQMAMRIKEVLPKMMVISTVEIVTMLQRQLYGTMSSLVYAGLIVWVMSVMVVGAIFSAFVNEQKREIGLLRALGFRRSSVFKLIIYESTLLTSLGGVFGILLGTGFILYLGHFFQTSMKMPYLWPTQYFIGTLILICVSAGLASGMIGALYPAARSSMMEPLQAIRMGE